VLFRSRGRLPWGRGAAHSAGQAAEQATGRVGDSVKALGQTVREHGPKEGVLGQGKEWVADALEGSGNYLSEQGLNGMADSLTQMVKNNPIPALLVGIGFGFLLARVVRS